MNINTKYKDSVFSALFSTPDTLRELYSALEGVTVPPDIPITINTLTDVLYMDNINDVSFTVDNRMVVLIEHQSSINPNMPLRLLLYIARVYEKIMDRKKFYLKKLEKIPLPEFIVLYNGTAPFPDHKVLKLSDAFKDASGLKAAIPAAPALELVVQVYNINKGHNQEILQKCSTLYGYAFFIALIRENKKTMKKEDAVLTAVKHCIEHGIIKQFLETHSTEVINMLDWNIEEAEAAWRDEYLAIGREEGLEKGREEIAKNALAKGFSVEVVRDLTGLDTETLNSLSTAQ